MRRGAAALLLYWAPALLAQPGLEQRAYLELFVNDVSRDTVLVYLRGADTPDDALVAVADRDRPAPGGPSDGNGPAPRYQRLHELLAHRRRARRLQRLGRTRREPAREPRLHRLLGPARSQFRARPFLPGPGRSVRDAAHPARRRDRVFLRSGRHRAALRDQRDARGRAGSVLRPAA